MGTLSAIMRRRGARSETTTRRPSATASAVGVVVLVTAVSVALRLNTPTFLAADWNYDDALYTRLAGSLLEGKWLGPYDFVTVSKGPGYPLFIAAAYKAHVPLRIAEHMVHLLAAATMGLALAKVSRSRLLGVIAYCVIALDPAYLGHWTSRITRDGVYGSISLLLVAATLLFLAYVPALVRRGPAWAVPGALASGLALGLLAGAYYITRDERPWLAPALLASGVVGVATWRREGKVRFWHAGGAVMLAVLVGGAGFAWSIDQVASRNQTAYGTSVISDLTEGEIARAYAEWQRVDAGEPKPLTPVTAEQREAVYAVSPSAAELEPHLKGQGTYWMGPGCAPPTPAGCDFYGGYFVWAMREAAAVTGNAATGGEAQRFFGRLADEITAACDTELRCLDPGFAAMPPWERVDTGRIWPSFQTATSYLFSFDVAEPEAWPSPWPVSSGTPENWEIMVRPLRGVDRDLADYNALEERAADRQQGVAALTDLYRWAARLGVVPAVLGLALALLTRAGRRHWPTLAVGLVMLVAAASRVVLLGLIDATAFVAARWGAYIVPGVDFLLVFLVAGWWLLATVIVDEVRRRRAAKSDDDPPLTAERTVGAPAPPDGELQPEPQLAPTAGTGVRFR
jgi:hypothetical protein